MNETSESSLKQLEQYLDEQSTSQSSSSVRSKSPRQRKNSRGSTSPNINRALVDNYKSQLTGWSPAHSGSSGDQKHFSLDSLSLGPSAEAQSVVEKEEKVPKKEKKVKEKKTRPDIQVPPKKPKMSKKERRELQEAQRAAKAAGTRLPKGVASPAAAAVDPEKQQPSSTPRSTSDGSSGGIRLQYDDKKRMAKRSKNSVIQRTKAQKQMALFSHLPQYERESSLSLNVGFSSDEIHPAILTLGLKYAEGKITGANARCVALLTALKEVVTDYKTPDDKMLIRDLDKKLRPLIQFLIDCRPHSIGMGNAIRYVRNSIATTSPELSEEDAKLHIIDKIDTYIQERIVIAVEGIVANAASKIVDGDVILTFARSHVLESLLINSKELGRKFRVVVVDSRPLHEGRALIRVLSKRGIHCTYVMINAVGYIMREVTKVFLGASAFMSNGAAIARVGTATIAMTARACNVPVLFCCETYKFSDRVQLDSITQNELGDPDDLVKTEEGDILSDWRDIPSLNLLNLVYDVTPIHYVSMVVTEAGMTPPTSIPVLIREYRKEATMVEC